MQLSKEDRIILEELLSRYDEETILNEMKIPAKGKLAALAAAGLLAGATISDIASKFSKKDNIERVETPNNPYGIPNYDYNKIKEKQKAVRIYIAEVLAKHGKSLSDLKFNPDNLVIACYLYDYDLPLLLAQLQVESHFGTTDRAKRTNSMFSVGAYDDGRDIVKYKDQDASIVPYIKLINKNYLLDGKKDVDDLLSNFVNGAGKRYASNPNYENDLKKTRYKIMRLHPELLNDYECEA
jgi:hypothetical protein